MCLGVSWLQFLVVSFGMSSRSLNLIFGIGCAWLVEVEFSLSCRECVGGSRGVYLDRECFSQFSLVCYRTRLVRYAPQTVPAASRLQCCGCKYVSDRKIF